MRGKRSLAPATVLEWLERRFPGEWFSLPATASRDAVRTADGSERRANALIVKRSTIDRVALMKLMVQLALRQHFSIHGGLL